MSITVDFPAPVRDWILHNLTRGADAQSVAGELVNHGTAAEVAAAMVDAVTAALMYGTPLPGDRLEVGGARVTYEAAALRVPAEPLVRLGAREVRVLARFARPAAALFDGLLSAGECDELIALAKTRLVRSTVVDPVTGRNIVAGHRSSDGMFFRPRETQLIARLEDRIAELTGQPAENGEGLQMLYYEVGAESTPHVDYLVPGNDANRESIARSGQRVATMLMYLNDVERGGETLFPQVGWSVVPRRGQAFYFEYGNGTGRSDPASLHASAPVLAGEKWVATKWIRTQRFVPRGDAPEPMMR